MKLHVILFATLFFFIGFALFANEPCYVLLLFSEDLRNPDKILRKLDNRQLFATSKEREWAQLGQYWSITNHNIRIRVSKYGVAVGSVNRNVRKKDVEDNIRIKKVHAGDCIVLEYTGWYVDNYLASLGYEPVTD